MKKGSLLLKIIAVLLLVLLIPLPFGPYKDGGTKEYRAFCYRIVKWNRLLPSELTGYGHPDIQDGCLHRTCVYFIPDNFKSLEELYSEEMREMTGADEAKLTEIDADNWTCYFEAEVIEGEGLRRKADGQDTFVTVSYFLRLKDEFKDKLAYRGEEPLIFTAVLRADKVLSYFTETPYRPDVPDLAGIYLIRPGDIYELQGSEEISCDYIGFQPLEDGGIYLYLTGIRGDVLYTGEGGEERSVYTHYANIQVEEISGTLFLRP